LNTTKLKSEYTKEFRNFFRLEKDVLILSIALFAFSLGFQMVSRYMPRYLSVLGASAFVIGIFGSFGKFISAFYPYPGGLISDRLGSRNALTWFGIISCLGFVLWLLAPYLGFSVLGFSIPTWFWIFPGLVLAQAWKSFGLGAMYAVVKQSVSRKNLATGFASTETFRRTGFLLAPLIAAGVLFLITDFSQGFQIILLIGLLFGISATFLQHKFYELEKDSFGKKFEGLSSVANDLRSLPAEIKPLLIADTLIRFGNGMVYIFFVIVVTELFEVDLELFGYYLSPDVLFGILLGLEMFVALLIMIPASKFADKYGLKPVIAAGFLVYAIFPLLLISAPETAWAMLILFAFSGLRFAGLPSHKALIVGPAEKDEGGKITGTYYTIRNFIIIPSSMLGGILYSLSPEIAFGIASIIGILGTGYFLIKGKELEK